MKIKESVLVAETANSSHNTQFGLVIFNFFHLCLFVFPNGTPWAIIHKKYTSFNFLEINKIYSVFLKRELCSGYIRSIS